MLYNVHQIWSPHGESFGHVLDDRFHLVMQYTGLKDKNGKEIFEGDWVKSSSGQAWEVRWIERTAKFQFVSNNIGFDMDVIKDGEVVGNIYES